MAVSFEHTLLGQWNYVRGTTLHANFETAESRGNLACATFAVGWNTTSNTISLVRLLAAQCTHYADITAAASVTFTGDLTATTTTGSLAGLGNTIPVIGQWIDIDTKDDATERTITSRVNEVPWFNYTNSSLYDKLVELYPGYGCFCISTTSGNASVIVPNPYNAGLNSNYNYYHGQAVDFGLVEDAPGLSSPIPANIECLGENKSGNPAELAGQSWSSIYALGAYLLLSPPEDQRKCTVDFYFNGTKEPNITMQWKGTLNGETNADDDILNACRLHVVNYAPLDVLSTGNYSTYYTYIDQTDGIRKMNDVVFNNSNKLRYINPVNPPNKMDTTYLSQVQGITGTMTTAQKILDYGINGLPEHLAWYIQVEDPNGDFTSLWQLAEPRESDTGLQGYILTELADARYDNVQIALEVFIHEGTSDDDTGDDPPGPPPLPPDPDPTDWDDDEGVGFPGNAVLTKTYSMTAATLANIGQKLWTQSYYDVLKIQNNPIQNIVSVKWFPFNLNVGTSQNVKVGNVDFGIPALVISTVKTIDIGEITYNGVYGNYLDGSPYTTLKLNLPYVGQIQLDAGEFLGKTIGVQYIVDLVTGECVARVKRGGIPLYDYPGHMGVDIVLTASDRVQADMKAVSSGIHTAANVAGEMITGDVIGAAAGAASGALNVAGMDYNSQRVGSPSGVCGSFQNHKVWLTVSYPLYYQSEGFTHVFGRPCNKYLTLSTFNNGDYVQVDRRTDLKIAMTGDENAELEQLLINGVYI